MLEKLLVIYKDSQLMEIVPRMVAKNISNKTDFDMDDIIDFFSSWKNGMNRRFMVKEIQNKFRFGVAFAFLQSHQHNHESVLFVLVWYYYYYYIFINKNLNNYCILIK